MFPKIQDWAVEKHDRQRKKTEKEYRERKQGKKGKKKIEKENREGKHWKKTLEKTKKENGE